MIELDIWVDTPGKDLTSHDRVLTPIAYVAHGCLIYQDRHNPKLTQYVALGAGVWFSMRELDTEG